MTSPRKTTHRWKRIGLNIGLALVLLLLVVILAVIQTPSFYRNAADRDMTALSQNARQFSSKMQDFASEVISDLPSVLELSENNISGCLAAANDDDLWEDIPVNINSIREAMRSHNLRNPQISIQDDRAVLAGETTLAGIDVVVSVTLIPHVQPSGGITIEVVNVYAGMLPLPRSIITDGIRHVKDGTIIIEKPRAWRVRSLELTTGKLKLVGEPDKQAPQADP